MPMETHALKDTRVAKLALQTGFHALVDVNQDKSIESVVNIHNRRKTGVV